VDYVLGNVGGTVVRTRAERPWLEWGVVGDVMPCDRERKRYTSETFDAAIRFEKNDFLNSTFIRQVVVTVLTCI
jgi:hypothetical protein